MQFFLEKHHFKHGNKSREVRKMEKRNKYEETKMNDIKINHVVVDMGDHYVLIGGDASYSEAYMLNGNIDGVCVDGKKHQESIAQMSELCRRNRWLLNSSTILTAKNAWKGSFYGSKINILIFYYK